MKRPRATVNLRGTFPHAQYRRICDALDTVGEVYSSMCTEESTLTVVLVSLNTCSTEAELKSIIRHIVGDDHIADLVVHIQEEAHAEKCI